MFEATSKQYGKPQHRVHEMKKWINREEFLSRYSSEGEEVDIDFLLLNEALDMLLRDEISIREDDVFRASVGILSIVENYRYIKTKQKSAINRRNQSAILRAHLKAVLDKLMELKNDGGFSFNDFGFTLIVRGALKSYSAAHGVHLSLGDEDDREIYRHDNEDLFCEIIRVAIRRLECEINSSTIYHNFQGRQKDFAARDLAYKCLIYFHEFNPGKATLYPDGGYMLFVKSVYRLSSGKSASFPAWAARAALKNPPWRWREIIASETELSSTPEAIE